MKIKFKINLEKIKRILEERINLERLQNISGNIGVVIFGGTIVESIFNKKAETDEILIALLFGLVTIVLAIFESPENRRKP